MVSLRSGASRSASPSAPGRGAGVPMRTDHGRPGDAADRAIRRDFDALAARIRILQARIQREASALHARQVR